LEGGTTSRRRPRLYGHGDVPELCGRSAKGIRCRL
jgi:hypothetical protein